MLGVLLDRATIDSNDIEFDDLESIFSEWRVYDYTSKAEVHDRIAGATIVVSNKVMLDEAALRSAARLRFVCIANQARNHPSSLALPRPNQRRFSV